MSSDEDCFSCRMGKELHTSDHPTGCRCFATAVISGMSAAIHHFSHGTEVILCGPCTAAMTRMLAAVGIDTLVVEDGRLAGTKAKTVN